MGFSHSLWSYVGGTPIPQNYEALTGPNFGGLTLLPALGPGWTIILDNASFHKGANTKELVEKAKCYLLYLPPYSPDFNPIEHQWARLKSRYRTFKQIGYDHDSAIDASF